MVKISLFDFETETIYRDKKSGRFISPKKISLFDFDDEDDEDEFYDENDNLPIGFSPPRNRPNELIKFKFPNWENLDDEELKALIRMYYKKNRWANIETRDGLIQWTFNELKRDK